MTPSQGVAPGTQVRPAPTAREPARACSLRIVKADGRGLEPVRSEADELGEGIAKVVEELFRVTRVELHKLA
eukprot:CAMPEP_0185555816 /NCGR_PEP_ID=MMETSP1381-20130426/45556_1 /TAXON_ID=298111 /ORGANISM="Pavlova sp., Strain CCMP459" /LENGTH=71 /DNA_ID=CAMNT_0028169155 /DNA_START=243 /DNA_END=458 /DNA_ORIENTATION=+